MESLEKSLGMLCPVKGPPAGSEKHPAGEKPRTTVVVDVGFVVVRVVEVEVMDGVEVVEGSVELVVLVGVDRLEDEEEDDEVVVVEEVVEEALLVLLEAAGD
jgi:hypothetical protein